MLVVKPVTLTNMEKAIMKRARCSCSCEMTPGAYRVKHLAGTEPKWRGLLAQHKMCHMWVRKSTPFSEKQTLEPLATEQQMPGEALLVHLRGWGAGRGRRT